MFKNYLSTCLILLGLVCLGISDESYAGPLEELAQADADWKSVQFGQAESGYKAVALNYPSTNYALTAQKKLVMLYKHDQPKAKAAFQELCTNFSAHEQIANTIYDIAVHYRETESYKKYEMVKLFCQHILDNWPESKWAIWAQSKIAASDAVLGEESSAEVAFNTLISNFSDHEHVAKAAYDIVHAYNLAGDYSKAERLYQRIINTWPPAKYMMWIHIDMAHSYIPRDNDANAQTAVGALFENISSDEFIPGALYDIAQHYERVNKHEKARQVYQEVVNKAPQDYYAMWAQMGVVVSDIHLGDEAAVQSSFNKLVTDFSGNERLPDAVFYIGENYKWLENYEKAKQYYQYVLDHWPRHEHHGIWTQIDLTQAKIALGEKESAKSIIDEMVAQLNAGFPYYSHWPAVAGEAYCHAAYCYRLMGEAEKSKECYQKIVANYQGHRRVEHAQGWLNHYNAE
jgi:tetratricopeptide (TPR) repeat protein